jgi:hypothetical protein
MKLVLWLVKQIGGDVKINRSHDGQKACFTIAFCP